METNSVEKSLIPFDITVESKQLACFNFNGEKEKTRLMLQIQCISIALSFVVSFYFTSIVLCSTQVVFGDINATVGADTEREFVDKYGRDKVKFLEFDATHGPKFEGK